MALKTGGSVHQMPWLTASNPNTEKHLLQLPSHHQNEHSLISAPLSQSSFISSSFLCPFLQQAFNEAFWPFPLVRMKKVRKKLQFSM